ncbi:MAG: tail fiber domain-containing protein [Parcubacteria group bacterium]|nr:tail fiber domain-containing protein [Parcubacteria group bacterium]
MVTPVSVATSTPGLASGSLIYLQAVTASSTSWLAIPVGVNGQTLTINASGTPAWSTFSVATTTINGASGPNFTFNAGTTGTDFVISTSTNALTFNLPSATSTVRGLLTATDWTAFNSKESAITASTTTAYYRGDKTWQTLNTAAVAESANLYYTDARARNALSSNALGLAYSASTGQFALTSGYNIPLTASTTNWDTFYNAPSNRITAGTGLAWSSNTLAVDTNTLPDASSTARGFVSTSTQTFAGAKTFSGSITTNGSTIPQGAWTSRAISGSLGWKTVAYGNGTFVAVPDTNIVATSPDGITWTQGSASAASVWRSVTYGNGLFVAVGSVSGTGTVMTSPDGITWTNRTAAANNQWTSVTYGNGLFVAVSNTGTGNRIMTSPDGITWTSRVSAADNSWQSVIYGNSLFVAVGGSGQRAMTSPDGITWTIRSIGDDSQIFYSVAYGNGVFAAIGGLPGMGFVQTSPDGITWTNRTPSAQNDWRSVIYAGGQFVAVASSGTGDRVMVSPDGIVWTTQTSAADSNWKGIAFGNGVYVAVADSGTNRAMSSSASSAGSAITSNGGVTIASINPGTTTNLLYNQSGTLYWNGNQLSGLSSGITSVNGLTSATQTFAVGTAGANFGITSSGNTHTFNLPDASATARGLVSTSTQTFAGDKTFSGALTLATTTATGLTLSQNGLTLASSTPSVTTNALYNEGGTLKWNGSALGAGSQWTTSGSNIYYNAGNVAVGTSTISSNTKLAVIGSLPAVINPGLVSTGGTIISTTVGGTDTVIQYNGSGSFTPPTGITSVQVLVVAGGGGGGSAIAGGGGAGGYISNTSYSVTAQSYTVTVGAGGSGGVGSSVNGANGSNSVFGTITAIGGGGGAAMSSNGGNGGSGGGARGAATTGGTGIAGQGNNGGIGSTTNGTAGGGGGAGAVGATASGSASGAGGNGTSTSITGSSVPYAGGGGGGGYVQGSTTAGAGGTGGGGAGGVDANGTNGNANTGGGGGGGGYNNTIPTNYSGGNGGSGVVIVRFATVSVPQTANTLLRVTDASSNASTTLAIFENSFGMSCIIEGQTASLACSSDKSLKKNIGAIDGEDALSAVLALDPVKFDWILNGPSEDDYVIDENGEYALDKNGERIVKDGAYAGFIAQDVEQIEILKGLVTDVGGKKALQYDRFVPFIVRAFQQFVHKVDGFLVTLESGWRRLTANELCLVDDNTNELVCVTAEKLRSLGGSSPLSNPEGQAGGTGVVGDAAPVELETQQQAAQSETPAETVPFEDVNEAPTAELVVDSTSSPQVEAPVASEIAEEPVPAPVSEPVTESFGSAQDEPAAQPESTSSN